MKALLVRLWRTAQARRVDRRLRDELPDLEQASDTTHPDDVEQVAQYLWVATCRDRQHTDPSDYALAAVIWLNYGLIRLPVGARPLDDDDLRGLPPTYRDRTDVTS